MSKEKKISKRQLAVIEELFSGELDEQAVLEKHKVSRALYNKWHSDTDFIEQFDKRIAFAYRQSEVLIARYAPLAAAKLIELTESEKAETARKACLDIISMPALRAGEKVQAPGEPQPAEPQLPVELSEQTAGRLLAVLAQEKEQITPEKDKKDSHHAHNYAK